jgi:hypothetical protein
LNIEATIIWNFFESGFEEITIQKLSKNYQKIKRKKEKKKNKKE